MKLIGTDQNGVVLNGNISNRNNSECEVILEVDETLELYPECTKYIGSNLQIIDQEKFNKERANKWNEWRLIRNNLLAESDWTQLADVTLTDEAKAAWLEYRQALRDMIDEDTNPFAVEWPEKP